MCVFAAAVMGVVGRPEIAAVRAVPLSQNWYCVALYLSYLGMALVIESRTASLPLSTIHWCGECGRRSVATGGVFSWNVMLSLRYCKSGGGYASVSQPCTASTLSRYLATRRTIAL